MPAPITCIHGIKPLGKCRPCRLERQRAWDHKDRLKRPEHYKHKEKRRYPSRKPWRAIYQAKIQDYLKKREKISRDWLHFCLLPGDRQKIWDFQKGLDPLTGEPLTAASAIDHCHRTGLVRGILNWRSNQYLSHFERFHGKRDYGVISQYLANPPAVAALGGARYGVVGRVSRKAGNRRYGPNGTRVPIHDRNELLKQDGLLFAV